MSMSLSWVGRAMEAGRRRSCARLVAFVAGPGAALRLAGTAACCLAAGDTGARQELRLLRSCRACRRCPACAPSLDICAASSSTSKGLDWRRVEASHSSGDCGPSLEAAVGLLGPALAASLLHWQLM